MNFLAHLWVADATATSRAGAVLGDFVKGPDLAHLPPPLARGVRLHRRVDAVSDHLPAVRQLKRRFPSDLRRYAGIILDLGFDHVLAREWDDWHPQPLAHFAGEARDALVDARAHFPPAMQGRLGVFSELLCGYRDTPGLVHGLERTAQRLRRPYNPSAAQRVLEGLDDALRSELPEVLDTLSRLR